MTIQLNMQKNIAQIRVHKRRSVEYSDRGAVVFVQQNIKENQFHVVNAQN